MKKIQALKQKWHAGMAQIRASKVSEKNFRYSLEGTWLAYLAGDVRRREILCVAGSTHTGKTLISLSLIHQMAKTAPFVTKVRGLKKRPHIVLFLRDNSKEVVYRLLRGIIRNTAIGEKTDVVKDETTDAVREEVEKHFLSCGYGLTVVETAHSAEGRDNQSVYTEVLGSLRRRGSEVSVCFFDGPCSGPSPSMALNHAYWNVQMCGGVVIHERQLERYAKPGAEFPRRDFMTSATIHARMARAETGERLLSVSVPRRKHYKAREESSLLELRTFDVLAMVNHVSTAIQPFAVDTASFEA